MFTFFLKRDLFWSWQLWLWDIIISISSCPHVEVSLSNTEPQIVPDEQTSALLGRCVCMDEWEALESTLSGSGWEVQYTVHLVFEIVSADW